jgi:hypothetical protein
MTENQLESLEVHEKGSLPRMKVLSVRLATARAQRVLPVPGGPYNKTPLGGSIPRLANRSGWYVSSVHIWTS